MPDKRFFEFAFVVPHLTMNFPTIKEFLGSVRLEFPPEILNEVQLFTWIGSDSLGILFRYDFRSFKPSYFQWFVTWKERLQADVIEMENIGEAGRDLLMDKCNRTSDIKFVGVYDLDHALEVIKDRLKGIKGVRKFPRIQTQVKVKFKTAEAFVREYADNISFGGMFIKGKTNLPLRSKIEIIFELPNREEIRAIAEIVHVVTEDRIKLINGDRVEGYGIQFVEFLDDGEEKLWKYFESLR